MPNHPLEQFLFCPKCGGIFVENGIKSKCCESCGFEFFYNVCVATAAFIINSKRELQVCRRASEPGKGTMDLPGGFLDSSETAEQGLSREILEETGIMADGFRYLFSFPNKYLYSGFLVRTLDFFFLCCLDNAPMPKAMDDVIESSWISLNALSLSDFGLESIRAGVGRFLTMLRENELIMR